MKPNAILINIARGSVVDEAALLKRLSKGELGSAGLDVYKSEPAYNSKLAELDNVVLTPHLGTSSLETRVE